MIFNSLGSNYDFKVAIKSLFSFSNPSSNNYVKRYLSEKYNGEVELLYKGREALRLALDRLNLPKGSKVGITGYTCYAVYKVIDSLGLNVRFLDIDDSLNFSIASLKKESNLKVIVLQNTLGNPSPVKDILEYCKKNQIILIEDLAHCVGGLYEDGKEVGNYGDFVVMSFSQDKVIDSVSGGALITRNKKFKNNHNQVFEKISLSVQIRDRLYPLFTYLIRKLYPIGLGKSLHYFLKKTKLLSNPFSSDSYDKLHFLPNWYLSILEERINSLGDGIKHRREISKIYKENLINKIQYKSFSEKIEFGSCLRFPIKIKSRYKLISFLKNKGIYLSDIWYDAPVSPKNLIDRTKYKNECPKSKKISEEMLNLPTHTNLSVKDAYKLSYTINTWLNSQQN